MRDDQSLTAVGGLVAAIGIAVLLVGIAMPATSTHTSETCVDDPLGYGQDCVRGSVTTPNPMKGPAVGIGLLATLGGIGIYATGRGDSTGQHRGGQSAETAEDGFAAQLRDHQSDADRPADADGASNRPGDTRVDGSE